MRASLPICIGSAIVVVLLTWWLGTRSKDFLKAPSAERLEAVRMEALRAHPAPEGRHDALSANPDNQGPPIPVILPRHLKQAPALDDFRDEARYGPDYLVDLAKLLEAGGHQERALACWERVMDSSKANAQQYQDAMKATSKLKAALPPSSNQMASHGQIMIQIGTAPSAAQLLGPVLDDMTQLIEDASYGLVEAKSNITAGGESPAANEDVPIALWISGPTPESPGTDILSFTTRTDQADDLALRVDQVIYRIIRSHLSKQEDLNAPPALKGNTNARKLMLENITRLQWSNFVHSLNSGL